MNTTKNVNMQGSDTPAFTVKILPLAAVMQALGALIIVGLIIFVAATSEKNIAGISKFYTYINLAIVISAIIYCFCDVVLPSKFIFYNDRITSVNRFGYKKTLLFNNSAFRLHYVDSSHMHTPIFVGTDNPSKKNEISIRPFLISKEDLKTIIAYIEKVSNQEIPKKREQGTYYFEIKQIIGSCSGIK